MKVFAFIIFCISVHICEANSPNDLIDFDKKSTKRYLKKHKVITAYLDHEYNFGEGGNPPGFVWFHTVSANFTTVKREESFGLYMKLEDWTHEWLEKHKKLKMYFFMNEQSGLPELIGYSSRKIDLKIREKLVGTEKIELIDYTKIDTSSIKPGDYIVGSYGDMYTSAIFPSLFKRQIMLIYPFDLKAGHETINTYGGSYYLSEPISVSMAQEIVKHSFLVLKKDKGGYVISGFYTLER